MRTSWLVKARTGAASVRSIELTAAADGLTISTSGRQQVVRYWYDTMPGGELRQFFRCPVCERICRSLYFDQHWGCRTCLKLEYPIKGSGRIVAAHRIEDIRRSLIKVRPGSPRARQLLAQIAEYHAILSADVARIRRDLRRRLKKDYKR